VARVYCLVIRDPSERKLEDPGMPTPSDNGWHGTSWFAAGCAPCPPAGTRAAWTNCPRPTDGLYHPGLMQIPTPAASRSPHSVTFNASAGYAVPVSECIASARFSVVLGTCDRVRRGVQGTCECYKLLAYNSRLTHPILPC
jgi:hypothetical protein